MNKKYMNLVLKVICINVIVLTNASHAKNFWSLNEEIKKGDSIVSPNGKNLLKFERSGNLVFYTVADNGRKTAHWSSNTNHDSIDHLIFTSEGLKFVISEDEYRNPTSWYPVSYGGSYSLSVPSRVILEDKKLSFETTIAGAFYIFVSDQAATYSLNDTNKDFYRIGDSLLKDGEYINSIIPKYSTNMRYQANIINNKLVIKDVVSKNTAEYNLPRGTTKISKDKNVEFIDSKGKIIEVWEGRKLEPLYTIVNKNGIGTLFTGGGMRESLPVLARLTGEGPPPGAADTKRNRLCGKDKSKVEQYAPSLDWAQSLVSFAPSGTCVDIYYGKY